MELQGDLTINGKHYRKGDFIAWYSVYPFFLLHMGAFGVSGFFMAYAADGPPTLFLYLHGGFACLVYLIFYITIFGVDKVQWMLVNALLGLFGIYAQIGWILSRFGKQVDDFSPVVHFIPFLYYVLYTFLLHQMVLDIFKARSNPRRRMLIDVLYIVISLIIYGLIWRSQR